MAKYLLAVERLSIMTYSVAAVSNWKGYTSKLWMLNNKSQEVKPLKHFLDHKTLKEVTQAKSLGVFSNVFQVMQILTFASPRLWHTRSVIPYMAVSFLLTSFPQVKIWFNNQHVKTFFC